MLILTANNRSLSRQEDQEFPVDEADIRAIKEALKRTCNERFLMVTRLYKIQQAMSKATITHKPFKSKE